MLDLVFEAVVILLSELRDENKGASEYLSILYGRFRFLNTPYEDQKSTLGNIAVNYNAKHPFGALTGQLQSYGFLGFHHAGVMAQACVNGDFHFVNAALINGKNIVEKKAINAAMGAFHVLPLEMHQSLFTA